MSSATHPPETTSGTITSWLPLTSAASLQAGCSSAIHWRSGFPEAVAFDPGFGITVDQFARCQPEQVTLWWETNDAALTALRVTTRYSIGPIACPLAYTTASTRVKDESSTEVFCCPSEYAFSESKLAGVIGQCYSSLTEGQTFDYVDGDFSSTRSVVTEDHSVVGVHINGWIFGDDATTTTTTTTSRSASATADLTNTRNGAIPAAAATTRVQTSDSESESLSGGVIAGIAIGALAGVALLVGLLAWLFLRKRRKHAALMNNANQLQAAAHDEKKDASYPSSADSPSIVSPLPVYNSSGRASSQVELDSTSRPAEMAAASQPVELHSTQYRYEMAA